MSFSLNFSPPKSKRPAKPIRDENVPKPENQIKPAPKTTAQQTSNKWEITFEPAKKPLRTVQPAVTAKDDPFASYLQPETPAPSKPVAFISVAPVVSAPSATVAPSAPVVLLPAIIAPRPLSEESLRLAVAPVSSNPISLGGAGDDQTLERIGRLESEKDVLSQKVKKYSESLESAERDHALLAEKNRSLEKELHAAKRSWEQERAEMQKELAALSHRDNQYVHEMRKKEREAEKLHKRLQQALGERAAVRDARLEAAGARRPAQAVAPRDAPEVDVAKRTARAAEQRAAQLAADNAQLRAALQQASAALHALGGRLDGLEQRAGILLSQPTDPAEAEDEREREAAALSLPLNASRAAVDERVRARVADLQSRARRLDDTLAAATPATDQLLAHLAEYQRIIGEQDRLLQFALQAPASPAGASVGAADESTLELERGMYAAKVAKFEQQVKHFDDERTHFAQSIRALQQQQQARSPALGFGGMSPASSCLSPISVQLNKPPVSKDSFSARPGN